MLKMTTHLYRKATWVCVPGIYSKYCTENNDRIHAMYFCKDSGSSSNQSKEFVT